MWGMSRKLREPSRFERNELGMRQEDDADTSKARNITCYFHSLRAVSIHLCRETRPKYVSCSHFTKELVNFLAFLPPRTLAVHDSPSMHRFKGICSMLFANVLLAHLDDSNVICNVETPFFSRPVSYTHLTLPTIYSV